MFRNISILKLPIIIGVIFTGDWKWTGQRRQWSPLLRESLRQCKQHLQKILETTEADASAATSSSTTTHDSRRPSRLLQLHRVLGPGRQLCRCQPQRDSASHEQPGSISSSTTGLFVICITLPSLCSRGVYKFRRIYPSDVTDNDTKSRCSAYHVSSCLHRTYVKFVKERFSRRSKDGWWWWWWVYCGCCLLLLTSVIIT